MNIGKIVKPAVTFVASMGVGAVIGNVIKTTTPLDLNRLQKISVGVGGFVLCNVLGDLAANHLIASAEEITKPAVESEEVIVVNEKSDD